LRQKLIISLTKETTSEQLLSYRRSSTHETWVISDIPLRYHETFRQYLWWIITTLSRTLTIRESILDVNFPENAREAQG
jgi:hypothetical protein